MTSIGSTSRPAYIYDAESNTWIPIGQGPHNHTAGDVGAIPVSTVDAKGDLLVATADNAVSRLGVGANGTVLTANSATATGLAWASPAAGGLKSFTLLNAGGTALTGSGTITVSGISNQQAIFVVVEQASSSAATWCSLRINSDSGAKYWMWGPQFSPAAVTTGVEISQTRLWLGYINGAAESLSGTIFIQGTNSSSGNFGLQVATMATGSGSGGRGWGGIYNTSATLSSVSLVADSGNFDGGTIYVYGMAV